SRSDETLGGDPAVGRGPPGHEVLQQGPGLREGEAAAGRPLRGRRRLHPVGEHALRVLLRAGLQARRPLPLLSPAPRPARQLPQPPRRPRVLPVQGRGREAAMSSTDVRPGSAYRPAASVAAAVPARVGAHAPVASLSEESRATFITRTYLHLYGAILGFTLFEALLFTTGLAVPIARAFLSVSWLWVLGGFVVVSWLFSRVAHNAESMAAQYAAL